MVTIVEPAVSVFNRVHKPVLGSCYSGAIPCRKACSILAPITLYVQLHNIDDAILCNIDDVMIVQRLK